MELDSNFIKYRSEWDNFWLSLKERPYERSFQIKYFFKNLTFNWISKVKFILFLRSKLQQEKIGREGREGVITNFHLPYSCYWSQISCKCSLPDAQRANFLFPNVFKPATFVIVMKQLIKIVQKYEMRMILFSMKQSWKVLSVLTKTKSVCQWLFMRL